MRAKLRRERDFQHRELQIPKTGAKRNRPAAQTQETTCLLRFQDAERCKPPRVRGTTAESTTSAGERQTCTGARRATLGLVDPTFWMLAGGGAGGWGLCLLLLVHFVFEQGLGFGGLGFLSNSDPTSPAGH